MKTATVRDIQHNLKAVLTSVAAGETIRVTRHRRVVAQITPPPAPLKVKIPDFAARLQGDFPHGTKGRPLSSIVDDERGPRP